MLDLSSMNTPCSVPQQPVSATPFWINSLSRLGGKYIDTLEHQYRSYTYWISCTQTSIPAEKANDIAEVVAREVQKICSCGLSDRYIGGMRLMCGSNNSTGQVVFLARMISLDGMNSTDLLPQLQQWTQTGPTIKVEKVSVTISADCSVHLHDSSRPTCICLTTNIWTHYCKSSWAQATS